MLDQVPGNEVHVDRIARVSRIAADHDQVGRVCSGISKTGRHVRGELAFKGSRPVEGIWSTQVQIISVDPDLRARNAALRIERLSHKGWVLEAEWIRVFCAIAEDGWGGGSVVIERWRNGSRWIAPQIVLSISQRDVVVENSKSTAYHPLTGSKWIVCKTAARTEDPVDIVVEYIRLLDHRRTGNPLRHVWSRREMEVRQYCSFQCHVRISIVVVADAVVDGQFAVHLPGVLGKQAERGLLVAIVSCFRLTRHRVVSKPTFLVGIVVDQIDHVGVLQIRLGKSSGEQGDVIAAPRLKPGFDVMRSDNPGQDIAPVIAVLNVIAVGEAVSPARAQIGHVDNGNGKKAGVGGDAFNAVITKDRLIQHVRRESMRLINLQ